MKTVLSEFGKLWPAANLEALKGLIGQVKFLNFPEDVQQITSVRSPSTYVVVFNKGTVKDATDLIAAGFEHIVQKERPDFLQELLTSCLMTARPKAFLNNPLPFLLTGSAAPDANTSNENGFSARFLATEDRLFLLNQMEDFLKARPNLAGISDLCIQTADELISNALFHAPVNHKGEYLYQHLPRTERVRLPENRAAHLFCHFSDHRLIIGCEDAYGSLQKHITIDHLIATLAPEKVRPRGAHSPGAGIGIRFMVENCANFYMYCEKGKRSLVACGFLTTGVKANVNAQKHLHLSFSASR